MDEYFKLIETFRGDLEFSPAISTLILTPSPLDPAAYCKVCSSVDVILDDGNYICRKCGTLNERFIDTSAEWRYYGCDDSKGNDPTRCGLPTNDLLPDSSLGSLIGWSSNESHAIRLMRKYHLWNSMSYRERTLYNVFDTLTLNSINNGLTKSIIDEAKTLYKQISEMKLSRGENRNGLIASSIYMSCKRNNVPRSAKEIAKMFNIKLTVMTKGCKKFQEILKLTTVSTNPDDFISRYCSRLELNNDQRLKCKAVAAKIEDLELASENTPPSIAAAIIFLCSSHYDWNISKKALGDKCEISQVTVTKCFKRLQPYEKLLINDS
jgi:transcription initiation factor TFIIB